MSNTVILLHEFYPDSRGKELDYCTEHNISLMGIITGSSPISHNTTQLVRSVNKALNYLIITGVTIEEIYAKFKIDEFWIKQMNRGILYPNRSLIERLVIEYKIKPSFFL
jgi:ABC-type amino acid transport substrate-binding protein